MRILALSNAYTGPWSDVPDLQQKFIHDFPSCEWRFCDSTEYSEADIRWANIIFGFPNPGSLKQAESLRWLHLSTAGVNGFEHAELYASPDVLVTRSAGVHGPAMAEHAIALALSLSRRFPLLYTRQQAHSWIMEPTMQEFGGSTVLLLGLGYLAKDLIARLRGFGCRIIGVRRDSAKPAPEGCEAVYSTDMFLDVIPQADYLISTLPLTAETRGFVGADAFRAAKSSLIFINMGRGATVQTPALIEALRQKQIAAAGLDVTDPEPLPADSPLWDLPNVIITPHCSALAQSANERRYALFRRQLEHYLKGEPLEGVLNFEFGY